MIPPYRGRFAPTPSGPLHLGSLVAALASYLDARAAEGTWLLRLEDLDRDRCRAQAVPAIKNALEGFGLLWDGEILTQSEDLRPYQQTWARLKPACYCCHCSRRDLQDAPHGPLGRIYPGYCRAQNYEDPGAWRLRLPMGECQFIDRAQGAQHFAFATLGDPILRRRNGDFAYALAVVVDDARQGITDVVRGADLLAATPLQGYLQSLLGWTPPRYLHIPLWCDAQGRKLSKQNHAPALNPRQPLPELRQALAFLNLPTGRLGESLPSLLARAQEAWRATWGSQ